MRRKISSIVVCMVLVLTLFVAIDVSFETNYIASGSTLYVGGTEADNYSTIQEAVGAAGEGDTIFIYSGEYDGPVNITGRDNLTFIGEDMETTKIKGGPNPDLSPGYPTYHGVHIKQSSNIIFNELNFWSDYFPLIFEDSNNITVDHSSIGGSLCWVTKVDCIGSSNIHIKNTRFWEEGQSNDFWAHFDSDDILIEHCTFEYWPYSSYFGDYRGADFWIGDDSHVFMLDCDTYFRTLSVGDTSTFTMGWYLTVNIIDTYGVPVEGATVWVRDVFSAVVNISQTDSNGRVEKIILKEFVKNSTSSPDHTPHNITAIKDSLRGFAFPEPLMNTNREVTITLTESYDIISLSQGYNLISFNRIQANTSLQSILQFVDGQYSAVQRYDALDFGNHWKTYHIAKPAHTNDLQELDHTMGFWLKIDEPGGCNFVYNGTFLSSEQCIPLYKGWNMVGYPSLTNHNRTMGLNNLEFGKEVDCIQWFDSSTKTWHFMEENDFFEIGRGYWIHAKSNCVWEVPL